MNREQAKKAVLEKIVSKQGWPRDYKATALASDPDLAMIECEDFELPDLFEELVREGELVEVEYILPEMDWRLKSIYLPKGTKVTVKNNGSGESQDADLKEQIKDMLEGADDYDVIYSIAELVGAKVK